MFMKKLLILGITLTSLYSSVYSEVDAVEEPEFSEDVALNPQEDSEEVAGVGVGVEVDVDDDGYDQQIIWIGPGYYYGVWFDSYYEYNDWYGRHYHHGHHGHGHRGHRGGRHGGHHRGHGGGHHH
jgi:hypothetical protein